MTKDQLQEITTTQDQMLDKANEALLICADIFQDLPPEVRAQQRDRILKVLALCASIEAHSTDLAEQG